MLGVTCHGAEVYNGYVVAWLGDIESGDDRTRFGDRGEDRSGGMHLRGDMHSNNDRISRSLSHDRTLDPFIHG